MEGEKSWIDHWPHLSDPFSPSIPFAPLYPTTFLFKGSNEAQKHDLRLKMRSNEI